MCRRYSQTTGLAYVSTGAPDAPLIVCVHGFPDIPRTWAPLTERFLEAGYRVVCPWLPGYAPSSLEGSFDLPSLSRTILSLIDEISPAKAVRIVGHDWGSIITQCALAQRPDRFRAAAILSVPHLLAFEANLERNPRQILRSAYIGFFRLPIVSDRLVRLCDFRFIDHLWETWSPGFEPGSDYFDELKLCLRASMPAPLKYYRTLTSSKTIREIRKILDVGPILVPTLYLHGERDGCTGAEMAVGQEKHFSALFETVTLADAGHFLHLERPSEVNAAIARWFEAHG